VNSEFGKIDPAIGTAIAVAADEVVLGKLDSEFPLVHLYTQPLS
jgi:fumarate hydratase class II